MKKVFVLLMAFAFLVVSCNNNKNNKFPNTNNREKDDYGKTDDRKMFDNNNSNTGWTEKERNSTLKDCIGSFEENQTALANKICPCVLSKLEREYPTYQEADSKGGEAAVERIALKCKEEIVGNDDGNNNTGYTWSKSDEDQWMSGCATSVGGRLGDETTSSYCSCVLEKLKKLFSSFDEMNTKGTHAMGVELGQKCRQELGLGQ